MLKDRRIHRLFHHTTDGTEREAERKDEEQLGRTIVDLQVSARRRRKRPELTWLHVVKTGLSMSRVARNMVAYSLQYAALILTLARYVFLR